MSNMRNLTLVPEVKEQPEGQSVQLFSCIDSGQYMVLTINWIEQRVVDVILMDRNEQKD